MNGRVAKQARRGARIIAAARNGAKPPPWEDYCDAGPRTPSLLTPGCGKAVYRAVKRHYRAIKRAGGAIPYDGGTRSGGGRRNP